MWRTKEKGERIEKHTIVGAKAESPTNGLAIEERRENGIDREEESERERESSLRRGNYDEHSNGGSLSRNTGNLCSDDDQREGLSTKSIAVNRSKRMFKVCRNTGRVEHSFGI